MAIPDPRGVPQVGPNNWNSAFLPAVFQGTPFRADKPIPHLTRPEVDQHRVGQGRHRDFAAKLNAKHLAADPGDADLAGRIASYETGRPDAACRLPRSPTCRRRRPRFTSCTAPTTPDKVQAGFARNCLLARRLLERDVRFVQLFNGSYAMGEGVGNWDGHKTLKTQYDVHAPILDQPCAALLTDLKRTRAAEGHAGGVGDGVRPDADVPEGGERPRPQPARASPSGWPGPG